MTHAIVQVLQRAGVTPFAMVCACGEVIEPTLKTAPEDQYKVVATAAKEHVRRANGQPR